MNKLNSQNKLVFSASTKISLHDRFTELAMLRPVSSSGLKKCLTLTLNRQKASAKNRRLAIQMANRPSVQAALKLKKRSIRHNEIMHKRLNSRKPIEKRAVLKTRQLFMERLGPNPRIDQSRLKKRQFMKKRNNLNFGTINQGQKKFNQAQPQNNFLNIDNNKNSVFKRFKSMILLFLL